MADNAEALQRPSTGKTAAPLVKCAECGSILFNRRAGSRFCDLPCQRAWGNRMRARGGPVMPLVQAWAMTRHAKAGTRAQAINTYARRELTAFAKLVNEQDVEAGRASVLDYVGDLMDARSMLVDRIRL